MLATLGNRGLRVVVNEVYLHCDERLKVYVDNTGEQRVTSSHE